MPPGTVVLLPAVSGAGHRAGGAPTGVAPAGRSTDAGAPDRAASRGDPAGADSAPRLRIPEGWYVGDQLVQTQKDGQDPGSSSLVTLGETQAFGSTQDATELGRTAWGVSRDIYPMTLEQLPDVELDGVEMYHLEGRAQALNWHSEFGAIVDDTMVVIRFQLYARTPPAQRHRIVEEVLATFEWK